MRYSSSGLPRSFGRGRFNPNKRSKLMPRKKRKLQEQPTDQQLGQQLDQAHTAAVEKAVKTTLPPDAQIADEDELKKQYGSRSSEASPAELFPGSHREAHIDDPSSTRRGPLADRDWSRYADPNPRHSVRWADGY